VSYHQAIQPYLFMSQQQYKPLYYTSYTSVQVSNAAMEPDTKAKISLNVFNLIEKQLNLGYFKPFLYNV
jgi:hypothetical protein